MTAAYSKPEAIEACEREIALNESADVDALGRIILDRKNEDFRRWLRIARSPQTVSWYFSEGWAGPSLQDAITSSEFHRSTAEKLNQWERKDAA